MENEKLTLDTKSDREILILTYFNVNELKSKSEDHEKRIRMIEKIGGLLLGGLYLIQFVANLFFNASPK